MAGNVMNPSVILYDAEGNPIAVKDGVVVPIDTKHLLVGGEHESDSKTYRVRMRDDDATPELKRLMVEAALTPGTTVQTTSGGTVATGAVSGPLEASGSSDMVVDGSSTPVKFVYAAGPIDDIRVLSLRLVMSSNTIDFNGESFGTGGGVLPNGVTIDIVANGGAFSAQLASVIQNEDFLRLLDFEVTQAGSNDAMAASIPFGGNVLLEAGTSDEISVTINDNLAAGNRSIHYFTSILYGVVL